MYRSGFLAMLLLCVSLSAGAEQYYFKHFDTDDGLPSNTVLCMTEDCYGFMWFGTKDGACRYDGKRCAAGGCFAPLRMRLVQQEVVSHL